ncbi:MAG: hypothetical protein A3A24_02965 [Candidatus Buchananbacteria bacterium RIFCSPLOWO2_01_FULL_46_12]|uniref:Uncharacterized protein n=1 Tax=Candidatus Buchananbacteria bacterium RIFCSPLOWO2_01_FULL_46_12 TaxID=1797546 RepID=A0A1G1YSE3_9BACT|nr:MAG: hypothetical protein A3A24_02965 [Candidatus Buchananbacteria bacterium RIFCSPLOWO2_01_FULL_46_12]
MPKTYRPRRNGMQHSLAAMPRKPQRVALAEQHVDPDNVADTSGRAPVIREDDYYNENEEDGGQQLAHEKGDPKPLYMLFR